METVKPKGPGGLHFSSSVAEDVWHADQESGAYEWWYFDALSDDGREALVIIFLAGFLFSPAYNRAVARHLRDAGPAPRASEFPALALCLYRDGRPVWRSIHEYAPADFDAGREDPWCRIGGNEFSYSATGEGGRYAIEIDQTLRRGQRLAASLAWHVLDGDLTGPRRHGREGHEWNLVAPRCRVTGTFEVTGVKDRASRPFSGTGYHDHNRDRRWVPRAVADWQWGRAHFAETTAVFYSFRERGASVAAPRLYVVRDGALTEQAAVCRASRHRRHFFGLSFPKRLTFDGEDGQTSLTFEHQQTIDSSFFYLRFLSEATLKVGGAPTLRAPAITEQFVPRPLAWPALGWLINMRIGRAGRPSFLP